MQGTSGHVCAEHWAYPTASKRQRTSTASDSPDDPSDADELDDGRTAELPLAADTPQAAASGAESGEGADAPSGEPQIAVDDSLFAES